MYCFKNNHAFNKMACKRTYWKSTMLMICFRNSLWETLQATSKQVRAQVPQSFHPPAPCMLWPTFSGLMLYRRDCPAVSSILYWSETYLENYFRVMQCSLDVCYLNDSVYSTWKKLGSLVKLQQALTRWGSSPDAWEA